MEKRRKTGLQFSKREGLSVGFLSSWVTQACLHVPVVRDVLMICVIAGVSVGAIVYRRVEGMGSRRYMVGCLKRRTVDVSFSVSMENNESDVLFYGGSRMSP